MTFKTSLERIRNGSVWNPNLDKYRVLRGVIHAKKATLWVGVGQLVMCTVYYVILLYFYLQFGRELLTDDLSFGVLTYRMLKSQLIDVSIHTLFVVLLIHVARSDSMPNCLLLFFVSTSSVVVRIFEQILTRGGDFGKPLNTWSTLVELLGWICFLGVQLFCLLTVCTYYHYLCHKEIFEEISNQLEALSFKAQRAEAAQFFEKADENKKLLDVVISKS